MPLLIAIIKTCHKSDHFYTISLELVHSVTLLLTIVSVVIHCVLHLRVSISLPKSLVYRPKMDQVTKVLEPGRQFSKDSVRLVKRCTKPDRKEFQKIAIATAIGFCIMGFIGFFVKLIHIPINNIIVGS
ncbi:protein transport protein Sec61 subunit gamma [Adelges cooleyi]|nr:protein transport protein Sec61 subunit gamma [Adelges cooleyi]